MILINVDDSGLEFHVVRVKLVETLLQALGLTGDVTLIPEEYGRGLPSVFAVDDLAAATVAVANVAVASLHALRAGVSTPRVTVDRAHAAVAFRSERHLAPGGWKLPSMWDPIAGDYPTVDGTIRIHTNYRHHREAVLRVLGVPADRAAAGQAIATWEGDALEDAIVAAGGAAARMRTLAKWSTHPQGVAVAAEPVFARTTVDGARPLRQGTGLAGLRVLDLTRVIAGPVATRMLAAHGADVLRIDPPRFEEVGALLPDVTQGKRRAALDLSSAEGRARFAMLVATADVVVCGYRGGSQVVEEVLAADPACSLVLLDAYGWTGPWKERRGFDSLVQLSSGIAARSGQATGTAALPAQALDHGSGYLLAAAACAALARRATHGQGSVTRLSLARVARLLVDLGETGNPAAVSPEAEPYLEHEDSDFGPLARVRVPGTIEGLVPRWSCPAGPLGVDPAVWAGQAMPSR